jgi:hypothetical protein
MFIDEAQVGREVVVVYVLCDVPSGVAFAEKD